MDMFRRSETELITGLGKNRDGRLQVFVDAKDASKTPPARRILRHVKKQFRAKETHKIVDPITNAAVVDLTIEGRELVFELDDMGEINIYAKDAGADALLARIAESLKQELTPDGET